MRRFYITSGDFDEIIEAKDPDIALEMAVKAWARAKQPEKLALIMRIVEVTAWAEVEYTATQGVLDRAGIKRRR